MNDVNRLRILQDVIDRRLTTRLAANRLEISDRHCRRLLERYREHGPLSLGLKIMEETGVFRGNTLMSGSIRTALLSSGLTALPCPLSPTTACENWTRVPSLITDRFIPAGAGNTVAREYVESGKAVYPR